MSSEPSAPGTPRRSQGPAAAPGEIAISVRGLGKSYRVYARPQDRLREMLVRRPCHDPVVAVRDVDLEVRRGETVGIVGRNGSGKSTLLQLISGTLEPTTGTVHVAGHVAPILSLGAGFAPEFTGRENVATNAAILGIDDATLRARWDEIERFADIGPFIDQPVKTYSSGMQARLAFAVAIHASPDILVIDEILAVGDEAFNRKCFARLEALKQAGSTILFVSHSAGLVVELCDRAILMENGERLLTADPKTVIARYHRLLYAPAEELPAVRQQIRELDRAGGEEPCEPGRLSAAASAGEPRENAPGVAPSQGGDRGLAPSPAAASGAEDRLDSALVSESTVEYARRGAAIRDPRIVAADGRVVNVLRRGATYRYEYEVDFAEAAHDVRFGMMIKLVTGVELGGQVSEPPRRGLQKVAAGTTARVRFTFRADLQPGVYFLNAGVLGSRDGHAGYLHRVLDAAVFRIDPEPPGRVTGAADLTAGEAPVVEIVEAAREEV